MQRLIAILIIGSILISIPAVASAQDSVQGIINGQIVNGTAGGGSVSGVEVTLITYVSDMISEQTTTFSDENGGFRFEGLSTANRYLVLARYREVDYYSEAIFPEDQLSVSIELPVCEPTDSDDLISIAQAYTLIEVTPDEILVTEYLWLINDGDRTFLGNNGGITFTLPPAALEFEAPADLLADYQLLDNQRVTYLVPFPPGERQLVYSFRLPAAGNGDISIPLEIDYPVESYELLVSGEGLEVSAGGLAPAEPVTAEDGTRYIHYQAEAIARGTRLDINISISRGSEDWLLLILAGIGALVIAGTGYYLIRKRKKGV
jgi:LPXTG-motif cell wall-anchored protein